MSTHVKPAMPFSQAAIALPAKAPSMAAIPASAPGSAPAFSLGNSAKPGRAGMAVRAALAAGALAWLCGAAQAADDSLPAREQSEAEGTLQALARMLGQGDAEDEADRRYLAGLRWQHSRSTLVGSGRGATVQPMLALQWGRWRINGGSGALLRMVDDEDDEAEADAGATYRLRKRGPWRLSASARFNRGRDGQVAEGLAPLPRVRATVRGRITLSKALDAHRTAFVSYGQDIANRAPGGQLRLGLNHHQALADGLEFSAGAALAWADRRYMRRWWGVPPQAGAGWPAAGYQPRSGVREASAHATVRMLMGERWAGFATVTAHRLMGPALHSPLAARRSGADFTVGLAWHDDFDR